MSVESLYALTLQAGSFSHVEGRVGSLIDDSGRFYKPLQTGARGDKEVNFFKRFHSDVNVPSSVKSFFPNFFGTIEIDTPNGGGLVNILKFFFY